MTRWRGWPVHVRLATPSIVRRLPMLPIGIAIGLVSLLLSQSATPVNARPAPTLPEPAPDSVELAAGSPLVLWVEGEVTWRPEDRRELLPTPLVIGERLAAGLVIEAGAGSRVVLMAGGDELATLSGSGRWLLETGRVTSLSQPPERANPERPGEWSSARSPRPRLQRLAGYREGPLVIVEPLVSMPLVSDEVLPMTLAITTPSAPVLRSETPEIRWHWPYEGGRFDLTLEEVDPSGVEVVRLVERWRNLDGKTLTPYAPLSPGGTYRVTVSLASTRASTSAGLVADSPILDRRVMHVLATSVRSGVDGALARLDDLQKEAKRFRPEFDVLRARLLESHGLWDEAQAVWTGLAILFPSRDDVLAHALRLHARSQGR